MDLLIVLRSSVTPEVSFPGDFELASSPDAVTSPTAPAGAEVEPVPCAAGSVPPGIELVAAATDSLPGDTQPILDVKRHMPQRKLVEMTSCTASKQIPSS